MFRQWRMSPEPPSPLDCRLEGGRRSKRNRNVRAQPWYRCPHLTHIESSTRRRGSMADLSIKNVGIGLASSLLAGAISVAAATGVGASTAGAGSPRSSYVYTESNQTSAGGGNAVLAFWVASGGTLTSIGSFATGGDGTGAGLGSQGAIALADGGHALLVVNAGSNTVSYFRILSHESLQLVG